MVDVYSIAEDQQPSYYLEEGLDYLDHLHSINEWIAVVNADNHTFAEIGKRYGELGINQISHLVAIHILEPKLVIVCHLRSISARDGFFPRRYCSHNARCRSIAGFEPVGE